MAAFKLHRTFMLSLLLAVLLGCGDQQTLVRNLPPPPVGPARQRIYYSGSRQVSPPVTLPAGPSALVPSWQPRMEERKWRFIIVHHSATDKGNAAFFDRIHRDKGWEGLGYHFTVGNGTMGVADGQVEIGPRWREQRTGAHCSVRGHPEYNEIGIGICLVGNFNEGRPSEAQMRSLAALIKQLQARYHIPRSRVQGHGSLKATDCPGKQFDMNDLYRRL